MVVCGGLVRVATVCSGGRVRVDRGGAIAHGAVLLATDLRSRDIRPLARPSG